MKEKKGYTKRLSDRLQKLNLNPDLEELIDAMDYLVYAEQFGQRAAPLSKSRCTLLLKLGKTILDQWRIAYPEDSPKKKMLTNLLYGEVKDD
jgi:hypothetical protein